MFWFNKQNPDVVFCDKRELEKTKLCDGRTFEVKPDVICNFEALPFEDNTFYLAVFDPPHLKQVGETTYMAIKYGKLQEDWPIHIRNGFNECIRVLRTNGILIFKWSEVQIPLKDVLRAIGQEPLFGHKSGKKSKTHWLCFMK